MGRVLARVEDMISQTGKPLQRVHRLEVAAQAGIHLRPVQHGFLTVEIHELFERERIPDDVTRHVFDGLLVIDREMPKLVAALRTVETKIEVA